MTKHEAIELVLKEVLSTKPDCSLIEEAQEEYPSCFVFYYQSSKYNSSRNMSDMYVGQGPVIVCKKTNQVFETGSQKSTHDYLEAFDACSDPNAEKTQLIQVTGWTEGAEKVKATKAVKYYSELGLADSKKVIDSALKEIPASFKVIDKTKIICALDELKNMGFKCRQLWSNEC